MKVPKTLVAEMWQIILPAAAANYTKGSVTSTRVLS